MATTLHPLPLALLLVLPVDLRRAAAAAAAAAGMCGAMLEHTVRRATLKIAFALFQDTC
jgi:hypothetical protein